jgi:anthranilate/para-aminobenzoate synthase component II
MSKHGLGDSKSHQYDKLTHAIIASSQWQPGDGHHHPLKQHLESHYAETTICEDLFGKQQKPSDWSLETKLFLFGLRATLVALPSCKPSEVVARAFGTNATAIDRIDITNLVQELAESSVSVLGTHTTSTSTPKETNMSAIVSPGPEYPPQHRHEVVSPCQDKNEMPRSGFRVGDKEYAGIDTFPQEILNALKDGEENINLKMNFSGTVEEMRAMLEVLTYKVLQNKETKFFSTVTVPAKSRKATETTFVRLPNTEVRLSMLQQDSKKRKANLVKSILEHLASASKSETDETELLKEVVKINDEMVLMKKDNEIVLMRKEDLKFSMPEVLALRHMLKCSANTLVKIDQFERMAKGNTRFPTQLKKKLAQAEKEGTFESIQELAQAEKEGTLESEKTMVELQLNAKDDTKIAGSGNLQ